MGDEAPARALSAPERSAEESIDDHTGERFDIGLLADPLVETMRWLATEAATGCRSGCSGPAPGPSQRSWRRRANLIALVG